MKNEINKEYSFTVTNDEGVEVVCDTLAIVTPEDDEELDPIIVYTDYTMDEENKFNVYVSKIVGDGENFHLEDVDNYEAIPAISQAVQKVWNEIN